MTNFWLKMMHKFAERDSLTFSCFACANKNTHICLFTQTGAHTHTVYTNTK